MVLFRDTIKKLLSLITFYFIILMNSFIHSMKKPLLVTFMYWAGHGASLGERCRICKIQILSVAGRMRVNNQSSEIELLVATLEGHPHSAQRVSEES